MTALANLLGIVYHYLVPPHPKFLVVPWRSWTLRVHVTSGTVELLAGLCVLFEKGAPGDAFLGEGALLTDGPRSATARAAEDSVLLQMGRDSFIYLLGRHASLGEHLQRVHGLRASFAPAR